MEDLHRTYLHLLDSLREQLAHLCDLTRLKTTAAQNDDLLALNEVLRQEQASTLAFRGLEQKREKQVAELGIGHLALSELPACFPAAMQEEARQTVAALQAQYQTYRSVAEEARRTLEHHLREIEQILEEAGVTPTTGPGYTPPDTDTPPSMKTDFRA